MSDLGKVDWVTCSLFFFNFFFFRWAIECFSRHGQGDAGTSNAMRGDSRSNPRNLKGGERRMDLGWKPSTNPSG